MLFTDGVSDARNRAGERLGEKPCSKSSARSPEREPATILERSSSRWTLTATEPLLRDDLTIVLVRS